MSRSASSRSLSVLGATVCLLVLMGPVMADVLVSSYYMNTIAKYADDGTYIGILVPSGSGGLSHPVQLGRPGGGRLYVTSDSDSNSVKVYDVATGAYQGNLVTNLGAFPRCATVAPDGNVYVAAGEIYKYAPGVGGSLLATLPNGGNTPLTLEWHGGDLYAVFYPDGKVRKYNGSVWSDFVTGLSFPYDIAFLPNGDMLVGNSYGTEILRYNSSGVYQGIFSSRPAVGMDVTPAGIGTVVTSKGDQYLITYDINGTELAWKTNPVLTSTYGVTWVPPQEAPIPEPATLGILALGSLLLVQSRSRCA